MTELIQQAIDKIDSEAEKISGAYAQLIASHIIDHNLKNDDNAKKVMEEKKTLSGCISYIKGEAKKEATGGMAMIDDETVFGWVEKYYEFTVVSSSENKIIDIMDFI